jgi:Flp pilus assembly protein TadB
MPIGFKLLIAILIFVTLLVCYVMRPAVEPALMLLLGAGLVWVATEARRRRRSYGGEET